MKYINGAPQFDPRALIDMHRTAEAVWNRHRVLLRAVGTPITVFYITGLEQKIIDGKLVPPQACYCALDRLGNPQSPDRDHHLCYGVGVLPGWDRYGYKSHVVATTTAGLTLTGSRVIPDDKNRLSTFALNDGSLVGTIVTPDYPVSNFLEFTSWVFRESVDRENNRNEYEYSIDSGTTWIPIPINYTNKLNPVVDMSVFPQPGAVVNTIRFRITQRKRVAAASTPLFGYIKFRYRNMYTLAEIDDGYREVTIPATLMAYQNNPFSLTQGNSGLYVEQKPTWWTLPESRISNGDVIMYLLGHRRGRMYMCSDAEERTYMKYASPMSISFQTKYIMDEQSDMGVTKYLASDSELLNQPLFYHSNMEEYFPSERDWTDLHYKTNHPSGGLGTV